MSAPTRQTWTQTPTAPGLVEFDYRVETWTPNGWTTIQSGATPPLWRPRQTTLDCVAQTILSNARPILGLGPTDRLPPTRVRTAHRPTGLTGTAHSPLLKELPAMSDTFIRHPRGCDADVPDHGSSSSINAGGDTGTELPLLDVGGYLSCGCHGSDRDHTCGPLD